MNCKTPSCAVFRKACVVLTLFTLFAGCRTLAPRSEAASRDALRIDFSEWVTLLPWDPADDTFQSGRLYLAGDRERIGPGQRWAETLVVITEPETLPAGTTLHAKVYALTAGEPLLAERKATVTGPRALVQIDLRTLPAEAVRLRTELRAANGSVLGVGELRAFAQPCNLLDASVRIPVVIDRPADLPVEDREAVTFGVPFAAGALWDVAGLRLTDGQGKVLPAQFEPVGFWGPDGAIQWVRVDALVPPVEKVYVRNAPRQPAIQSEQPVRVTTDGEEWLVDTGAAQYRVGAGGALVRSAAAGGVTLAEEGKARGLYLIDQQDRLARACPVEAEVTVEAAGPVTASLRIEGNYRTAEGEAVARHITRLEFFAGQPTVRATHTLVLTRDTNEIWFKESGWEWALQTGAQPRALLNINAQDQAEFLMFNLADSPRVRLAQEDGRRLGMRPRASRPKDIRWVTRTLGSDRFTVRDHEGAEQHAGERMGDWAALQGEEGLFLAVCRDAAAQHPKDFEISADRLTLRLFSPAGGAAMDFRMPSLMQRWGMWPLDALDFEMVDDAWQRERIATVAEHTSNAIGWSRTHELLFAPLAPDAAPAEAVRWSRALRSPVWAHVDPDWLYATRALGPLHPRDPEQFPEAEAVIDGVFWNYAGNLPGAYTGYFDYFAGPHYGHPGRYRLTYTYLSDAWLVYARSGERAVREVTQRANRAFMDNYIAHWEGPLKTRGLFLRALTAALNTGKTEFPLYWEDRSTFSLATTSNLYRSLLDYYLTGYRRGGDIVRQFGAGMQEAWTVEQRDWRGILTLRLLGQVYGFTWDENLRAMVEQSLFAPESLIIDPEGEVLLSKNRPYRSTTYKTPTDMDVFVEIGDLLGSPRAYHVAEILGRFTWERSGISGRATGVNTHALWERTNDPLLAAGFDRFRRVSGLLLRNPETGETQGLGWSQMARIFQGLPRAMDVARRTEGLEQPQVSWLNFTVAEQARAHCFVLKDEEASVELLIRGPAATGLGETGQAVSLVPHARASREWSGQDLHRVTELSSGVTRVRIPKDAPGGVYEIVLLRPGTYTVFADRRAPLSLWAPEGFHPAALRPPLPVYFQVPEDAAEPGRLYLELEARIFTPDGTPFQDGESLSGWVDLPADTPGLWRFEAVDPGRVQLENLPALFSLADPAFYLEAEPLHLETTAGEPEEE